MKKIQKDKSRNYPASAPENLTKYDPIQLMMGEHVYIKEAEIVLKQFDLLWEKDAALYEKIIKEALVFFREYSEAYHHRKEEDILFPAIACNPSFTLDELIIELEHHHDSFREYTKEIETALNEKDYAESYKTLRRYLDDLLDHISVEDDEFFVLAESLLSNDELEVMYFMFLDVDRDLGEVRKKELEGYVVKWEKILDKLEKLDKQ